MGWNWTFLLYSIIILSPVFSLLLHFLSRQKSNLKRLPPGPPGWPVFGHMFDLGTMPHRMLAGLEKRYGPVVWLRLGSINTMVVLTAQAAKELFKNHDQTFADRYVPNVFTSHDYDKGSLVLAPYGPYCHILRRICTMEMFVAKKINQTEHVRQKCIEDMRSWIEKEANEPGQRAIRVAHFVFRASFNVFGNLMLSRDLIDPKSREGTEFFLAMTEFMKLTGQPNLMDLFPRLGWLDPQGLMRKMDRELGKILLIASGFVKERIKERQEGGERRKDFLDALLDFEGNGKDEPAKLSEGQICIFILEMFLAGTETTSSSVEWAMSELLRHPEAMIKVKLELSKVVGPNKKMEESDIDHLQYLQAVIKETLRLHPAGPLLIPRKAVQDTEFMGYHIPKNTQVFVNAWAIGRDPECWEESLSFKPERFLGSKIDYKGQHFELIPFGAGRRICVGLPLGHCMLHLVLGSLLHEFDWELKDNVIVKTMDMRERIGLAGGKLEPLEAIPKKRTMKHID